LPWAENREAVPAMQGLRYCARVDENTERSEAMTKYELAYRAAESVIQETCCATSQSARARLTWTAQIARVIERECFADAGPAPDGPLKAGERVWVHEPGRAVMGYVRTMTPQKGRLVWVCVAGKPTEVRRAACHREGPKGEPPEEGAVFLGRFEVPYGMGDFWRRADGRLQAGRVDDSPYAEIEWPTWTPEELSAPDIERYLRPVWTTAHRAALVVAYELGLVPDAEPENVATQLDMIQQPEPKRPEHSVSLRPGDTLTITLAKD